MVRGIGKCGAGKKIGLERGRTRMSRFLILIPYSVNSMAFGFALGYCGAVVRVLE